MATDFVEVENRRPQGTQQALWQSEERFRLVVELAPSAMVMISQAGAIELVNAQAERVFGYARAELLGQPVEMLVPERFRAGHPEMRRAFFTAPPSRPMGAGRELYGLGKDGSEFPVEIGLNPIGTADGAMVLSAIVDISERKRLEAPVAQDLKEKEILLGEIHHRVKNNLQIIDSLLEMQVPAISESAVLQVFKDAQNRIRSMALIHQTLYQSHQFARVDFSSFLDALIPDLSASYAVDPSRIALTIEADDVPLPINVAIPCGLVVNELVTNAFKHAFPGDRSGRITISLRRDASGEVVLAVTDDGVGIPESFDIARAESLGLQLVSVLTEQVAAKLTIQRANPTRLELRLPDRGHVRG